MTVIHARQDWLAWRLAASLGGGRTSFTDAEPGPGTWHYLVVAEDVRGNESDLSNEAPAAPWTGVDEPTNPTELAQLGNHSSSSAWGPGSPLTCPDPAP